MPTDEPTDLTQAARELYAVVPSQFVAERNARAARLRQDGEREPAAAVKKLPKATAAAWAVSAVVREAGGDLDALGELGAELRVAQRLANPTELRALSRRRRDQVAALTRTAVRIAEEQDVELSPAAQEQVSATWQAVVIDPRAERAVRSGLLLRALEPGQGDLSAALGVPADLGERASTDADEPEPAVADDDGGAAPSSPPAGDVAREVRRLRRDLRSRERIAQQMREELDEASEELGRVEAEVLQVAAHLEELRREAAEVEEQLEELDEARVAAREEREDAADRANTAVEQLAGVRERLAELDG